MLLHALHSCPGARFSRFRTPKHLISFPTAARQQHSVQAQASRPMEVLAAAEATAPDLDGVRLDAALSVLFPGRWKSSTGGCGHANQL